jgi:hypothetical protein
VDWPTLDALAYRLRWQLQRGAFTGVGAIPAGPGRELDLATIVQVLLGDIDYDRRLAGFAGAETELHSRRRALASRVCCLLGLTRRGSPSE